MKSKNTKATAEKAKGDAKMGKKNKRSNTPQLESDAATADGQPENNDGTDDHLHHPLPASSNLKTTSESAEASKKLDHADIQSLQETAEIAGKVVLLSRGGCGFLEKVKWVQRRGGVALIVGDDIRGGPLVTMYARGDTSNVTIPSLFTSHTTAHLLSTLMPSGGLFADLSDEEVARLGFSIGDKGAPMTKSKVDAKKADLAKQQKPKSKPSNSRPDDSDAKSGKDQGGKLGSGESSDADHQDDDEDGWFSSLFGGSPESHTDSRRPPSSGKIDWVLQEDFEDDEPLPPKAKSGKSTSSKQGSAPGKASDNGFVIGVQDWRDPDLLDSQLDAADVESSKKKAAADGISVPHGGPNGGSITPGSGEYGHNKHSVDTKTSTKQSSKKEQKNSEEDDKWLSRLGWSGKDSQAPPKNAHDPTVKSPHVVSQVGNINFIKADSTPHDDEDGPHEGLWVTLTPTSMSSSPFFDTLLVLVVSPLVTLTIVYALLLLRSRIRRRRWRAPKSVVDRLPVRTYQTIPSPSSTSANSSNGSPPTTPTSATPLLQSSARSISQSRPRPRSRTASEVPASSLRDASVPAPSPDQVQEKREAALAEWRRRYGGRQKECVVCLEEYVDGISRVMSLPCGHEFHAECMLVSTSRKH